MRHLATIKKAREALLEAHTALVEKMIQDPDSSIHILDYTPEILRDIMAAIEECDTYDWRSVK
jgi:hypothetical protein